MLNDKLECSAKKEVVETYILDFEKKIGVSLPESYVSFIYSYNGCSFKKNKIFICESVGYASVHHLYGFNLEGFKDISINYERFKLRLGRLVSFADDDGGNQFCFDLESSEILYWDNECLNTYSVSTSFDDFLQAVIILRPENDVDIFLENDDLEGFKKYFMELVSPGDAVDDVGRNLLERAVIKGCFSIVTFLLSINFPLANAKMLANRNATFFPDTHKKIYNLFERK